MSACSSLRITSCELKALNARSISACNASRFCWRAGADANLGSARQGAVLQDLLAEAANSRSFWTLRNTCRHRPP